MKNILIVIGIMFTLLFLNYQFTKKKSPAVEKTLPSSPSPGETQKKAKELIEKNKRLLEEHQKRLQKQRLQSYSDTNYYDKDF